MVIASSEPAGFIPDKTVPAYTPPSGPANITHEPIARGEAVVLSPTHPLGTVKEGGGQDANSLVEGQTITLPAPPAGQMYELTATVAPEVTP